MEIKIGDKFNGVVNNCLIEVIKIEKDTVVYKDLKTNKVFSYGLEAFKRCNIVKVA